MQGSQKQTFYVYRRALRSCHGCFSGPLKAQLVQSSLQRRISNKWFPKKWLVAFWCFLLHNNQMWFLSIGISASGKGPLRGPFQSFGPQLVLLTLRSKRESMFASHPHRPKWGLCRPCFRPRRLESGSEPQRSTNINAGSLGALLSSGIPSRQIPGLLQVESQAADPSFWSNLKRR